ncbi:MAG: hypothetical protein K2L12_03970 [Clostridia bacterium]|nr:hypothetical protein [Clostridia bacterium]
MAKYKQNNKKWSWSGFWIGAIALTIIVPILAGVIGWRTSGYTDWTFGFRQPTASVPDTPNTPDDTYGGNAASAGGVILTENESNGISLLSAEIPVEAYEANGISPLAETAYTLTATIDTDDEILSQLEWSIGFVNPSSSWASGKSVSDFVPMSVSSDMHSATLSCAQAFGEPIKVTVKAKWYPDVKAECTVDYIKRVTGVTAAVATGNDVPSVPSGKYFLNFTENKINVSPTFGVGTVQGAFTAGNSITIKLADSKLKTYLTNYISSLGVSSQFSVKDSFSIGLSEKLTLDKFMNCTGDNSYMAQYKLIFNELYDCVNSGSSNAKKGDWKFTIPYTYVYGSFSQNGTSPETVIEFFSNGVSKYKSANTVTVTPNVAF